MTRESRVDEVFSQAVKLRSAVESSYGECGGGCVAACVLTTRGQLIRILEDAAGFYRWLHKHMFTITFARSGSLLARICCG